MRSPFQRSTLILGLLLSSLISSFGFCRQSMEVPFVRPITGSRMIVGDGEIKEYTWKSFLHLCGKPMPKIALIQLDGSSRAQASVLQQKGAGAVTVLNSLSANAERLTLQLIDADGVWVEGNPQAITKNRLLVSLLKNVNQRGGVIAVASSSVSLLPALDDNDVARRLQSPFSKCLFHFGKPSTPRVKQFPGKVHWVIPDASVLVVHKGRQVAGYGQEDVRAIVGESKGWPQQAGTFECPDVFSSGSYPFYGLDLLAWVRSANERTLPVFPSRAVPNPELDKGTLFLHGGSGVSLDLMREFVKLAGGKNASIVCIPSAKRFDEGEFPDSYSAAVLHEIGHSKVSTLHASDPLVADQNDAMATMLKKANGVWIDGGRTYRFMDCYEGTRIEALIADVLARGGVVGGSSAGCQVPSDFLVRGNPRTNRDIVHEGYTRGMGLLKGVIIDAHFLQRGRHEPFLKLMKRHPQMLGIGIDERTALIVQGHQGKVLGDAAVSFYNLKNVPASRFKPTILKSGESYDLQLRKPWQE